MEASLARDLAHAAREMAEQPDLQATLDTIAAQAVVAVGAGACGIFLLRRGTVQAVAVSTAELRSAEQAQIDAGEGPCLDTLQHTRAVHVADLRVERRWPRWAPEMVGLGWLSLLSVPLSDRERTVGTLNLVDRAAGGFTEPQVQAAHLVAGHASLALAAARTEHSLGEAVRSRHAIGVAQGILVERYDVDVDQAFAMMRRSSQEGNVKLRDVAEHVLQHRRLPGSPGGTAG
ncbi:GAF and ANTAR domain-containing protein [Microlunatus lacustris]